ncbi:class I SAM-dependent methyltransferase [Paraburkholderia sp.]|uniref:class I SAM-dependent methyltransferase n=1 Tax=Paraburkholderia sp. TaxID=1926495 RepID=UPI00286F3731|nr:class I SAM-dependent methyltransferase [Paraburkholderia sp.]
MSKTHFGYQTVDEQDKAKKVAGVFHSVASNYDLMNDLMSGGLHRAWKAFTIAQANIRPGAKVLDIAGGTGDLSMAFAKKAGPTGEVWHTDINESMLRVGRDRLIDKGVITPALLCDAEKIPFPDNYFDLVTVAFGLRNMLPREAALAEARRVLARGGSLFVLEFGSARGPLWGGLYNLYLSRILPFFGGLIAGDRKAYAYLARTVTAFPSAEELAGEMQAVGFSQVAWEAMCGGIVCLHRARK